MISMATVCWAWAPSSPVCIRSKGAQRHTFAHPRPTAAAAASLETPQLQLGADIPISLKQVTVGGRLFWLVVPDIDAVMEMYISAGQADRDPYWCEPWPSALAMSTELLQRPALVAGRRVCELGCGLGLAGLVAAVAGATEVVLLDREPLALQCALLNAHINGIPTTPPPAAAGPATDAAAATAGAAVVAPAAGGGAAGDPSSGGGGGGVAVPSLSELLPHLPLGDAEQLLAEQAQRAEAAAVLAAAGRTRPVGRAMAEVFDWSRPVTIAPHDVMLVCDCLYEAFSVQPVAEVAPRLLTPFGSRLLLADPPDRARHNRECFLDILCEDSGEFVVEEAEERWVLQSSGGSGGGGGQGRTVPIAMMHLRRTAGSGDTVGVKLRRRGEP